MTRPLMALLALGLVWTSAPAAVDKKPAADDPVALELTKAKEEYQGAVKGAGEKLVAAFAAEQKKMEENTKLKVAEQIKMVEQIQEERKAFEADPARLPKAPSMKVAVSDYQTKVVVAKKKCEAAFEKAAEGYRGKKDLAKAVLAEKPLFFLPQCAKVFIGSFEWFPGQIVTISPDGTAIATNGDTATWTLNDKQECVMMWKSRHKNIMRAENGGPDLIGDGFGPKGAMYTQPVRGKSVPAK